MMDDAQTVVFGHVAVLESVTRQLQYTEGELALARCILARLVSALYVPESNDSVAALSAAKDYVLHRKTEP